ncbi:MAG: isochorismatase [Betaproteobacteria bacterium RIFCSPLOWO2_02_FULL_62_17]|nr:MAG: isochorismatase [Betaproteobacteria bacterium RIFCSPLOWO2_02_FULL_62_17]
MSDNPHNFEWPQYVIDRVMAKRGRLNVYERFARGETALLVIDMQNFYVAEISTTRAIVPNINRLAAAMRERGDPVIWVCMTAGKDQKSLWSLYHENFFTPQKGATHRDQLTEGSEGHGLYSAIDARPDDLYVWKTRFSPFIGGSSNLESILRARGVRNLVIAGTATNMCCETTARDAMMLDYRVTMVSDANAARYDEDHAAGLTSFYQSFGDVRTTDDILNNVIS